MIAGEHFQLATRISTGGLYQTRRYDFRCFSALFTCPAVVVNRVFSQEEL